MDSFLIDYLRSGTAWVLVGSGPSNAMEYPSWKGLAQIAASLGRVEHGENREVTAALRTENYPAVFDLVKAQVGGPRLLQALRGNLIPRRDSRAYRFIAAWPVPVYLTTNFDDEIHSQLVKLGEPYVPRRNSPDDLALLESGASGVICKLHGDLTSEDGIILTATSYKQIAGDPSWRYWRTKLTSIFQMHRVVVVGHSLVDPHVQHLLAAAKEGAGVQNPVCWIAPDVSIAQAREFLEKWRIRVVPYDNRDGTHDRLITLLEMVSNFVPPRVSIRASTSIMTATREAARSDVAAIGLFVFNKLAGNADFEERRLDIVLAALQSITEKMGEGPFDLVEGMHASGWPRNVRVLPEFRDRLTERAVEQRMLVREGDHVRFTPEALRDADGRRQRFDHQRQRFKTAVTLRLRREFPLLDEYEKVASGVSAAFVAFFRLGGLTLATTLLTERRADQTLPASIAAFITEASAQYSDLLARQAFSKVALDSFIRAGDAEREFLGRLSQGFFAYHALGVLGEAAFERLKQGMRTVWVIDSNVQIASIAVGAPVHVAWRETLAELRDGGFRFFATERLFDETHEHLRFAQKIVEFNGAKSNAVYAGAVGDAPYRKSNLFLQGFISWQAAGNPCDWESYLFSVGGRRDASRRNVEEALRRVGIEVVPFPDWPGFHPDHQARARETAEQIAERTRRFREEIDPEEFDEMLQKAGPESEALLIVMKERSGEYSILSNDKESSPAWFISQTSMLNKLQEETITWMPDAFLKFASTLSKGDEPEGTERGFEAVLWGVAQAGVNVLDEATADRVFGGIVDQEGILLDEQMKTYESALASKYGHDPAGVVASVRPVDRMLARLQLANEAAQREANARESAQLEVRNLRKRAKEVESELMKVHRYKRKLQKKRGKKKQSPQGKRR